MRVQCSNCGAIKSFTYTASNVNKTISAGWRSYGSALYCPKCVETWGERNSKKIGSIENTITVIVAIHERNKKRNLRRKSL